MPAKPKPPAAGPFAGFRPAALAFFRDLAVHNEKEWFEANRAEYETEVRGPLAAFVVALDAELRRRGLRFTGDPKSSVFRINRDVRFSNDKSPYKTNAGATLTRDGRKDSAGMLYFHLDPEGSFAAAGFYRPEPPALAKLRNAVVARTDEFVAVVAALKAAGLTLSADDTLKRLPRGFEAAADSPVAGHLKLKSLVVGRKLPLKLLRGRELTAAVADLAAAARPLLDFGWAALAAPA